MAKKYYICCDCDCKFEEMGSWEEDRGEFWGTPCKETMYGCPICYSTEVEEVIEYDTDNLSYDDAIELLEGCNIDCMYEEATEVAMAMAIEALEKMKEMGISL